MTAMYERDPDGVIHAVMEYGDANFTYCGRDFCGSDGPETQTFEGERASGPATCLQCNIEFNRLKAGMIGTRWARALVNGIADG